ncbi:MAG: glucosamine-1-phosphate N-acetyltransferase [Oscillospiraceae bacterium]
MDKNAAVFWMKKEAVGPSGRPLMLESVMFCPVLEWMGEVLAVSGVQRIFVACEKEWEEQVRACFPGREITVATEEQEEAERRFLEENGACLRFEKPVLPFQGSIGEFETFKQLMDVSLYCRDDIMKQYVTNGVAVIDPGNTYIDPRVSIAPGAVILPGTIIRGRSVISAGCEIGPNSMVTNCTVGEGTVVNQSQINDSTIGKNVRIGPFAYIRPGCTVADGAKIGDFVELKNSAIGEKTSVSHLTYIGDSDVGAGVNFGCGTITTNYDGDKKYRCAIGDRSFIGCNTNLVAPVRVGAGAYIAAGTTVTKDVPDDALAIGRSEQTVKEGWAARRRAMKHSKY